MVLAKGEERVSSEQRTNSQTRNMFLHELRSSLMPSGRFRGRQMDGGVVEQGRGACASRRCSSAACPSAIVAVVASTWRAAVDDSGATLLGNTNADPTWRTPCCVYREASPR